MSYKKKLPSHSISLNRLLSVIASSFEYFAAAPYKKGPFCACSCMGTVLLYFAFYMRVIRNNCPAPLDKDSRGFDANWGVSVCACPHRVTVMKIHDNRRCFFTIVFKLKCCSHYYTTKVNKKYLDMVPHPSSLA